MSGNVFKGPMLVIVLGAVAVLGVRYLPVDDILERIRAAGATDPAGSAVVAPPEPSADVRLSTPVNRPAEPPVVILADTQAASRSAIEPAVADAAEPVLPPEDAIDAAPGPSAPVVADAVVADPAPVDPVVAAVDELPERIRAAAAAVVANPAARTQVTTAPRPVETSLAGSTTIATSPVPRTPDAPGPVSPATPDAVAARAVASTPVAPEAEVRAPVEPKPVAPKPVIPTRVAPKPVASPATSRSPEVVASIAKPAPVPVVRPPPAPAETGLRVLVEADVGDRSGLGRYTAESYASLLKGELETVSSDFLGAAAVQSGAPNLAFRDQLVDGRAGVERLCSQAGVQRVLLADVSIPSGGFSSVASAYWPEVRFTAINCGDGRLHKSSSRRLEPQRADRFEYQKDFAQRAHDFVASQGYFLRP
ncbi:MAG: hypothetical protein KDI67_11990 [Gammaproteobacteria bacterium]|nr:hypothetical protein [Gammaproteobacteria bacterium]